MPCLRLAVLLALLLTVFRGHGEDAPPDVNAKARDFLQQVSVFSPKQKDGRAKLAEEIKQLQPSAAPEGWIKALVSRRDALEKKFKNELTGLALNIATSQQSELDSRRKAATSFILGKDYASKASHTPMDELVKKVAALWDNPCALALETNENPRKTLADLREIEGYLALYPGEGVPAVFDEKKPAEEFNQVVRAAWKKSEWQTIAKYNDGLAYLSSEEKEHLQMLNEYRMMLGLQPLECDARLLAAARGHSCDMVEKKFFSHESPLPGKRSFMDRAKLEGYAAAMGENIFWGSPSGRHALASWYTSPGHHKNMLGNFKQIGAGNYKAHWTQVFGGDGPFALRGAGKPPQVAVYEKVLSLPENAPAKARLDVAQFAMDSRLWNSAKHQLAEVLKAEPENASAKQMLQTVELELKRAEPPPKKR